MSYGSIGTSSGPGSGFSQSDDTRRIVQLIERCTYNVQRLDNNVKELEKLCSQLSTGKPTNAAAVTSAISSKQTDTNTLINTSADLLQQLGALRTEDNMLNTRRNRLLEQYKSSVAKYKRTQELAMRRVHDLVQQQQQESGGDQQPHSGFGQQDQLQANVELLNMQEQEQRMRELLDDIVNIERMFVDLSSMVYEQGAIADDIAQNIDSAAENAETGRAQLAQAVVYKRKARKRCIIIIVAVLIAAGILALIIYLSIPKK